MQPAVSQQLRRLEAELGVTLVDRSTRRVALTAAGVRFLPEARSVLAAAERARDSVAADRATTLRLGTSTGLGERLPRLLSELERRAPDAVVELVRAPAPGRVRQIADGLLDAALLRGTATHPGVRLEEVWIDALAIALPSSHPLATADALALEQLKELPLRMPTQLATPAARRHALADALQEACRAVA